MRQAQAAFDAESGVGEGVALGIKLHWVILRVAVKIFCVLVPKLQLGNLCLARSSLT